MPKLQKHTAGTQRQGQASGDLSEMRDQIHEEDVTNRCTLASGQGQATGNLPKMREQIHEEDVRNEVPGGCE